MKWYWGYLLGVGSVGWIVVTSLIWFRVRPEIDSSFIPLFLLPGIAGFVTFQFWLYNKAGDGLALLVESGVHVWKALTGKERAYWVVFGLAAALALWALAHAASRDRSRLWEEAWVTQLPAAFLLLGWFARRSLWARLIVGVWSAWGLFQFVQLFEDEIDFSEFWLRGIIVPGIVAAIAWWIVSGFTPKASTTPKGEAPPTA